MMRPLAPVRVRGDRLYAAEQVDWIATCRVCGERLTTGEHEEALMWAHGHMHVRHPGWGRSSSPQIDHLRIAATLKKWRDCPGVVWLEEA